jgi:Fur family transcriptional regulator, zinc uptake regulator
LLETYLNYLRRKGYKCTRQRKELLYFFLSQGNKLKSAKTVIRHLRNTLGFGSQDTVYRNLYLFKKIGIMEITHKDGESLFYLKKEMGHHVHLFICNLCSMTKTLTVCPMKMDNYTRDGFEVFDHKFEVYGICPTCKKKSYPIRKTEVVNGIFTIERS